MCVRRALPLLHAPCINPSRGVLYSIASLIFNHKSIVPPIIQSGMPIATTTGIKTTQRASMKTIVRPHAIIIMKPLISAILFTPCSILRLHLYNSLLPALSGMKIPHQANAITQRGIGSMQTILVHPAPTL